MKDILAMVVSIMGFGAFLIYNSSTGWGWYLFVSLLILNSVKVKID